MWQWPQPPQGNTLELTTTHPLPSSTPDICLAPGPAPFISLRSLHDSIFNNSYFVGPLQEALFTHRSTWNPTYRNTWRDFYCYEDDSTTSFSWASSVLFLTEHIDHLDKHKVWHILNKRIRNRFERIYSVSSQWSWLAESIPSGTAEILEEYYFRKDFTEKCRLIFRHWHAQQNTAESTVYQQQNVHSLSVHATVSKHSDQ